MKKIVFVLLAGILLTSLSAQSFDVSKLRAGAGLWYASDIDNFGLSLNAVYSFTDQWEGAFGYTHIFKQDYVSWNIFDFDAHYIFVTPSDKLKVYALAGISIVSGHFDGSDFGLDDESDSDVGLNIGAGLNYDLNEDLTLSPELRFTLQDDSFMRLGASIQYRF